MVPIAMVALLALGASPQCADVPSRASSAYWDYIEDCGCEKLDPPSRASSDYERYRKACADWRSRNPKLVTVAPATPRPVEPICQDVPSRAASAYWDYIEDCGCEKLDPPSQASSDYQRFRKACADWRSRNPGATAP